MRRDARNALVVLVIGMLATIFVVPSDLKFESGFLTFAVSLLIAAT